MRRMRGYFGIGAEGISKPMNLGNLIRSAHAFGASFVFLIEAHYTVNSALPDTSQAERQLSAVLEAGVRLSVPAHAAFSCSRSIRAPQAESFSSTRS